MEATSIAGPPKGAQPSEEERRAATLGGEQASIARREQALLALVESDRARRCAAIRGEAEARITALLRDAHAEARARMRVAFGEERERRAARIAAAAANLQTRQRLARQQRAVTLLAAGWEALPDALMARWRDPAARRAWVAHAIAVARNALSSRDWRIVHAPSLPASERDALAREFAATLDATPAFVADPTLHIGLKIVAGDNVVDATGEGLLAERSEIGAQLLDLIE